MRRTIVAAVIVLTLAGCRYVPPPSTVHVGPHAYCYGEGGQVPTCVSQGSEGRP